MKNTAEIIQEKALSIFNTNGIASTSTRQISKMLDISDGNLRYHYKTKEELVIAILEHMKQELFELKASFSETEIIPDEMFFRHFFTKSYEIIYRYRCIYLDQVWLYHHMPKYREVFGNYVESWRSDFLITFNTMREARVFKNTYSDAHYKMVFEQLYMYSDSWIFYYEQSPKQNIDYYVNICLSILKPYWHAN